MSFRMRIDLLDELAPTNQLNRFNLFEQKSSCATMRLRAKKMLSLENGYFNEMESYAIYHFCEKWFTRFHHTAPTNVDDNLQRRKMYREICDYDHLEAEYFPQKPKENSMYLITNYGSEQAKVVEFTPGLWRERPSRTKIDKEVAMMDIECRPMRSDRSSGEQKRDSNKPEASLEEDSAENSSAKSTQQKSVHQGKAKTFKRKTKRRGRV